MNYFLDCMTVVIIYVLFFSMVGGAVYITGSGWCLWALLLTPKASIKNDHKKV